MHRGLSDIGRRPMAQQLRHALRNNSDMHRLALGSFVPFSFFTSIYWPTPREANQLYTHGTLPTRGLGGAGAQGIERHRA